MKKKKIKAIIICIIAAAVLAVPITGMCIGFSAASEAMVPGPDTSAQNSNDYLGKENFSADDFESKWSSSCERVTYRSELGNNIPIEYICVEKFDYNKPTVVLIPSYGYDYTAMYPLADAFLEIGYNIVTYDQRANGENNAPFTTFGDKEVYDLDAVIKYIKMCTSETFKVALLGQGTGASTAANYISDQTNAANADFAILEDPFSSTMDALNSLAPPDSSVIPESILSYLRIKGIKLKYDYSVQSADFAKKISDCQIPVLVMNHKDSSVCSFDTSNKIYESIGIQKKQLVTFENSDFMTAFNNESDKYMQSVHSFISEFVS